MRQADKILRHLKTYGSITPAEAVTDYGIYRLASVIYDLKREGVQIHTEIKNSHNRFNEPCKYAQYFLITN